jgi:hypothetical protein
MITLPQHVDKDGNWNGRSIDPKTGDEHPNLESSMSWPEHQRIVIAAGGLLASLDYPQQDQDANRAKQALMVLKAVYTTPANIVLYVTKGIHRPTADPHMQLRVEFNGMTHLYHLDVSLEQRVRDLNRNEYFHWKGVRFSAKVRNDEPDWKTDDEKYDRAVWPEGVPVTLRGRRQSVSQERLAELNQSIRDERARQQALSDRDKKRNEIVKKVWNKLGLKPENNRELPKLWAGGSANFVTEKKKNEPIPCTYDGKYFIHHTNQKMEVG